MVSTSKATKQPLENNPKSDKHLISPYNITSDSHIQVTGSYKGNYHQLKELMIVKKSQYHGKCVEKRMENVQTDDGV